jgi:twitching motility protein PilJ
MEFKLPSLSKGNKGDFAENENMTESDLDTSGPASEQYMTVMAGHDAVPPQLESSGDLMADTKMPPPVEAPHESAQQAGVIGGMLGNRGDIQLWFIGKLPLQQQIRMLLVLLGLSLLLSIGFVWINTNNSSLASIQTQIASDALMHSQRIGKAAPNAIQGNLEAFKQLADSRKEFNKDLNVLSNGGDYQGREIHGPGQALDSLLKDARKVWASSDKSAETILGLKSELTGFGVTLQKMKALTPQLQEFTEQVNTLKVQGGATPREVQAASQLTMLTQRLGKSANEFVTAEGVSPETAFLLGKDASTFSNIIDGFLNGSEILRLPPSKDQETRDRLTELQATFGEYQKLVSSILANLQKFIGAKQSEQSIFNENEQLKQSLSKLQKAYRAEQDSFDWSFWAMLLSALMALLSAAGIGVVLLQESRNRTRGADMRRQEAEGQRLQAQKKEEEAKATNDQNQAAILRLMNELQEVADGDLTVQATVSEDITGAIADSVNYTVEELRGLVGRVTTTAEEVTAASNQAQGISTNLLAASQQQSREIQGASEAVLKMAEDIAEVSGSANESADVARQSVAAAAQGSIAVENAIKGMNEIREQIQETSKRIKRLGESSQEIGEITELISDITEQTNVLALNAAIQAASAGEAGRGFSVVAEEVQRLAERSGEATKQIGALVRTIQTDTHDAVAAMEKSTQGVVEGARLSDAAGAALSDISRVSNRLAELIQAISFAAEQQAGSANGVAVNIQHILTVTEQTKNGTQQTALSIHKLSMLAEELKNSVSRFRVVA